MAVSGGLAESAGALRGHARPTRPGGGARCCRGGRADAVIVLLEQTPTDPGLRADTRMAGYLATLVEPSPPPGVSPRRSRPCTGSHSSSHSYAAGSSA